MNSQAHLPSPLHGAALAQYTLSQPSVTQAAGQFLKAIAISARRTYVRLFYYALRDLILSYGNVPIGGVLPAMVQNVVWLRHHKPRTARALLCKNRVFFSWARDQGYLPRGVPTAAELVQIPVLIEPLPITAPVELKTLLAAGNQVELRLAIALWSFAGIGYSQLTCLNWTDVAPGRGILLKPEDGMSFGLAVRIRPVLDAWLSPFYGRKGRVVPLNRLRSRIRLHAGRLGIRCNAATLRRSFFAYSAAVEGNTQQAAAQLGLKTPSVHQHLADLATPASAEEFFSLTPARVGIADWSGMVAEHFARSSAPRQTCANLERRILQLVG